MASYRVLVWDADGANFGPGTMLAEYNYAKNLGYAYYLNDIGEAFWTVGQYDQKVNLRSKVGLAHVYFLRNNEVVWRGVLAEHDANQDDVIYYAYGYEHIMYHLFSDWKHTWTSQQIAGASGRPVNDLWSKIVAVQDSQVGFASTGTLEAPVTTSGGATPIVLANYTLYHKRVIHVFKELVALATSDTTNIVYMELDYSTDPTSTAITFNFWKNNTALADLRLSYPGNILQFSDRYVPISARNDLLGIGSGPRGQVFRHQETTPSGTFGHNAFGLRGEPMFLTWVRDQAELARVTKIRSAKALREDVRLSVRLYPDSGILPARATGSAYELGDRLPVYIDHGITQIDKSMLVMGEQVIWVGGREFVQPLLEDRAGS